MTRLRRPLVLFAVACALEISALVIAQEPVEPRKVAAPLPAEQDLPEAKAPVIRERMAQPREVDIEAVRAPLLQHLAAQLRPVVRAELHLVGAVCGLSEEQHKEVARGGEQVLKNIVAKCTDRQLAMMHGRGSAAHFDPRKLLQEGLANALKAHLSPEQLARYQAELEDRAENRKRVTVRNLVSKMEEELILSAAQRDKLYASLYSHWNDAWCQSLELLPVGRPYFPNIPDQYVAPILSEAQKNVWRATQKVIFDVVGAEGETMDNELLDDEASARPQEVVPIPQERKQEMRAGP
jgi:hypothetical protein